jgi:hypothetical protein
MEKFMENRQIKNSLRQEKKYILSMYETSNLERKIISDGFQINHLPNHINNIYLEDYFKSSALENVEGDSKREKHRIRWYNNEKKFTLETKIKLSSSGKKNKFFLKSNNLKEACEESEKITNKKIIIQNSYFRKYYHFNGIRITIDQSLRFKLPNTETWKFHKSDILEIKFDTINNFNISKYVNNFSQLTKFSKYLQGLKQFNLLNY